MTRNKDSHQPVDRGDNKTPLGHLKGSVCKVDDPFEPGGREDWYADMLRSNNAVLEGGVPIHITSTRTRYMMVLDVPKTLQEEFVDYLTSVAVMRTFPSIARQWGLSDIDMASLLGLSVRTYRGWTATPSKGIFAASTIGLIGIDALTANRRPCLAISGFDRDHTGQIVTKRPE